VPLAPRRCRSLRSGCSGSSGAARCASASSTCDAHPCLRARASACVCWCGRIHDCFGQGGCLR
jgi:hypothetical protein